MVTKRYTDIELDKFEDQIDVLERRKNLFLTLGIVSIVVGALCILGLEGSFFGLFGVFRDNWVLNLTSIITSIVGTYAGIPGGIALLILRKALIMRKIKNLNKLIDDELDLREKEGTK